MVPIPDPLILTLGCKISDESGKHDEPPTLVVKFAPSPAAIVDGVELNVDDKRIESLQWRSKLVSVASPAYASFEIPNWMEPGEQTVNVAVLIRGKEWASDAIAINVPEFKARVKVKYSLRI